MNQDAGTRLTHSLIEYGNVKLGFVEIGKLGRKSNSSNPVGFIQSGDRRGGGIRVPRTRCGLHSLLYICETGLHEKK